jgi:hypothetical protein
MSLYNSGTGNTDAIRQSASAESAAREAHRDIVQVQDKLDRLTLACAALWELVKERTNLTENDLAARIAILDAKDGIADGKMTRTVQPCANCKRPISPQHRKCMYCGTEQPLTTIFESL